MTEFRVRRLAPALLLLAAAAAPGQVPGKADLEIYRDHFLKPDETPPKGGAVRVTFLGVATLLFDDGETQLMTDGFFSRPSLLQVARKIGTDPKAVDAALGKAGADRVKALFVAHTHYDHALDVAYVTKKTGAKLYGSASTRNVGRGGDLKDDQMVVFEPGKEYAVGKFAVTVLKGKHSPPIKGLNDDLGRTIDAPLGQPAGFRDYKEGGAFDFLVRHGGRAVLVMPSGNFIPGALDGVTADVLFLGVGGLGTQADEHRKALYDETVGRVRPKLVVPIHWDDFFLPLTDRLKPMADAPVAFDFLIERLKADKIRFGLLQGYQGVTLFGPEK
jgi:L-ascorbate metabolism protein UlaG (beta-lactamase superfamily)